MKKKISKKEAREKYGIITSGVNSLYSYFLLDNGDIIDSDGDIRYRKIDCGCEKNVFCCQEHSKKGNIRLYYHKTEQKTQN